MGLGGSRGAAGEIDSPDSRVQEDRPEGDKLSCRKSREPGDTMPEIISLNLGAFIIGGAEVGRRMLSPSPAWTRLDSCHFCMKQCGSRC